MRHTKKIREFVELVPTDTEGVISHLQPIWMKKILSSEDIQILLKHLTHESPVVQEAALMGLQQHLATAIDYLETRSPASCVEVQSYAAALEILRSLWLPVSLPLCFSSEEDAGPKEEGIPLMQTNTDVSNLLPQIQNRFEKDLPSLLQSDPGKWIAYSVEGPLPVPADFNLRRVYENCWNLGLGSSGFMVLPIEPLHTSTLELVTSCDSAD